VQFNVNRDKPLENQKHHDTAMKYQFQKLATPIGTIYLVASGKSLHAIIFAKNWSEAKKNFDELELLETPVLKATKKQLSDYFIGRRKTFTIPYEIHGTDFQKRTWRSLTEIPFGKTWSYKQQAIVVKSPKAVRAIGRTNGLNPLPIIIPCHRVIGSNGKLTGYAGGLKIKEHLLNIEGTGLN